jgi:hypothetical protein
VRDIDQVSPCDTIKWMACRAHFSVHLVAATNSTWGLLISRVLESHIWSLTKKHIRSVVKSVERTVMVPGISRRMQTLVGHICRYSVGSDHISNAGGSNNSSRNQGDLLRVLYAARGGAEWSVNEYCE